MLTSTRALVALSVLFISPCLAQVVIQPRQPSHEFNWDFANANDLNNLEPCAQAPLKVIPMKTLKENSTGPYSVVSFAIGGIPDYQFNVSTDKTNIPWTVRHPAGSRLMITIVDGNGNNGGFAGIVNVHSGTNTSCLRAPDPDPPTFNRVNVTVGQSINTCGLMGASVSGGVPPYGAFIVTDNSESFTPFNSSATTSRLTYKNRAPRDKTLIFAVQDSRGVWGVSTQGASTKGSDNATCAGGRETSWIGDAQFTREAILQANAEAADAHARKAHMITTILAVIFSILGAIVIGLGLWYWFRVRQPARTPQMIDAAPPYDPEKGMAPPMDSYPQAPSLMAHPSQMSMRSYNSHSPLVEAPEAGMNGPMDLDRATTIASTRSRATTVRRSQSFALSDASSMLGDGTTRQRSNSTSPFPPGRQPSRKALEAAEERRIARDRVPPTPMLPSDGMSPTAMAGPSAFRRNPTVASTHSNFSYAPSRQPSAASSSWHHQQAAGSATGVPDESEYDDPSEAGTIIIQHRDAGQPQVVVELPPAYMFDSPATPNAPVRSMPPPSGVLGSPVEASAGIGPRAM